MQLKDKVAIITGASRGIGYAIAQAYIEEGAKVALCGSRIASAEKAAGALKKVYPEADILPIGVDISNTESVDAMVKATIAHYGKIDILVNNAGVTSTKLIWWDPLSVSVPLPRKCRRRVVPLLTPAQWWGLMAGKCRPPIPPQNLGSMA